MVGLSREQVRAFIGSQYSKEATVKQEYIRAGAFPNIPYSPTSTTFDSENREENREIPVEVTLEVRIGAERIGEGAIVDATEPLVVNSVEPMRTDTNPYPHMPRQNTTIPR